MSLARTLMVSAAVGGAVLFGSLPGAAASTGSPSPNTIKPPPGGGGDWSWYDCIHGYNGYHIPDSEVSATFDHKKSGYVELTCKGVRHINDSHPHYDSNTTECIDNVLKNAIYDYPGSGPGNRVYTIALNDSPIDGIVGEDHAPSTVTPAESDTFRAFVVVHESTKRVVTAYTNGGKGGSAQWNECKEI